MAYPTHIGTSSKLDVDWSTPGLIEYVTAEYAKGTSGSQIAVGLAREFNVSLTRSAVIGKIHRLGLADTKPRKKKRAMRELVKSGTWFAVAPERKKAAYKPKEFKLPDTRPYTSDRLYVNGRPVPRPPSLTDLECEGGGVAFADHKRMTCHWPVGSTESGETKLCGCTIWAGAYCEKHAMVAYRRLPDVNRKPPFWG